jgi:lipoprotein-anchoring transpeptidase ErfK/SrfK
MRLLALGCLLVGNLMATEVFAEDVTFQPLTRADCTKAGMIWNDSANVCDAHSTSEEISSAQPLTREACNRAGLQWSDTANVCDTPSAGTAPQTAALTTSPVGSALLVAIDKSSQEMTVSIDGIEQYRWRVSTGASGYATPSGTFQASSMNEIWYSKQWDNAPMPHSIFFTKDGHAIHGSYDIKRLGRAVSHGCVRLAPNNASTLYALVEQHGLENTTVTIAGVDRKVAQPRPKKRKPQLGQAYYDRLDRDYVQPRRCGLFRRRWCGDR